MRRKTREVKVGSVGIGGDNPIRIQSMTTTPTHDVEATVSQIEKLAEYGCDIVRVTVQGMREVKATEAIKNALIKKGLSIPLVADIHFYPKAALHVVELVDKVRVNPGNFVDPRARFVTKEYDEATYQGQLQQIEDTFAPLVEKLIDHKVALRIGTNHGSLSDRIMNRYGDTPGGMVESAFEYARLCRKMGYHDLIFSMKSSNPLVMIETYQLLVSEMDQLGWDYPIHLGVTEAGTGASGRIKSAVGIGSLLMQGIGDTIRVSLTEDPWKELEPCKKLAALPASCEKGEGRIRFREVPVSGPLHRDGSVVLHVTDRDLNSKSFFEDLGCIVQLGRPQKTDLTPDALYYGSEELPQPLSLLQQAGVGIFTTTTVKVIRSRADWDQIDRADCLLVTYEKNRVEETRALRSYLKERGLDLPLLLSFEYEDLLTEGASECGLLLCEGLAQGLSLRGSAHLSSLREFSFELLQACRMRSSKTEFISCPGCGRTLFDLKEVSGRIRERTEHLPGVKIAIMGCIVNGPGEMADADFGYVGSRPGMIDLYVGKECVEKGVQEKEAVDRLIALIKAHDRWSEPLTSLHL